MEAIQEQIKTGKISGRNLLDFFSSSGVRDHKNLRERLVGMLTSDLEMLANFALILYRSGHIDEFKKINKDYMDNILFDKNSSSKNFLICISLYQLLLGQLYEIPYMSEVLTLYLSYFKITPEFLNLIQRTLAKFWDYNNLYMLYLTSYSSSSIVLYIISKDYGYFYNLQPSKEIVSIIKFNGDEKFFNLLHYFHIC